MTKAVGILLVLLLALSWVAKNAIEKNGQLDQQVTDLKEMADSWQKNYNNLKYVSEVSSAVIVKAEREKARLQQQATQLSLHLEILKNEDATINKWSISTVPSELALRLLVTHHQTATGNTLPPDRPNDPNQRTNIEVQNQALYLYTSELKAAIRSCNTDKASLREWYKKVDLKINAGD